MSIVSCVHWLSVFEMCKNIHSWLVFVFLVSIFDVCDCSSIKRMNEFSCTLTLISAKYITNSMILFHLLYLFTLCKYLFLKWLYIDFDESFFRYSTRIDVCRMVFVKTWSILIEQLILCMYEGKKVNFLYTLFFYSLQHSEINKRAR